MDLKSIAEAYQSIQEGKVNAGYKHILIRRKAKKKMVTRKKKRMVKNQKVQNQIFLT